GLVVGERFRNRGWPAASVLAAGERTGLVLRLPPREDVLAVGVLVVVGIGDAFGPVAAMAISDFDDPSPPALPAPVAELDSGRDGSEVVGVLGDVELQGGSGSLQSGSTRAAGHDFSCGALGSVPTMGVELGRAPWRTIDLFLAFSSI